MGWGYSFELQDFDITVLDVSLSWIKKKLSKLDVGLSQIKEKLSIAIGNIRNME